MTSLLLPHLSSSLTDSLPSLNLLCHSETHARFMQDGQKAVWSIPYVSVASFFPSFKQNFIAYRSSKVSSHPDCIFEIHQQWQSGFSRVYSYYCCSCSFEPEIIKHGESSHKMYSNHHHHHIVLAARISLTLSRHSSLSFKHAGFSRVYDNFKCLYKKVCNWRHHVYMYIYIYENIEICVKRLRYIHMNRMK